MNLLNTAFEQTIEDEILQAIEAYPKDCFNYSDHENRVIYGLFLFWNDLLTKSFKKHDKVKKVCNYQTPCSACQSLVTYSWHLINIHNRQIYTPKAYGYYGQSWFDPFVLINGNGAIYKQSLSQIEYLLGAKFPPFFIQFLEANPQDRYIQISVGFSQFRLMIAHPKYPKYIWADALRTSSTIIERLNKLGEYDGSAIVPFAFSVKDGAKPFYLCFKAEKDGTSDGKIYLAGEGFFQIADSFEDLVEFPKSLTTVFSISGDTIVVLRERHKSLADLLSIDYSFPYRELEVTERSLEIIPSVSKSPQIIDMQYHVKMMQTRMSEEIIVRQEQLILDITLQTKTKRIFGFYPFSLHSREVNLLEEFFDSSREDMILVYADRYHQKPKTSREYYQRYLLIAEMLRDIVSEFSKIEDVDAVELNELLESTPILKLTQKSFNEVDFRSY